VGTQIGGAEAGNFPVTAGEGEKELVVRVEKEVE